MARLKDLYKEKVASEVAKELGIDNVMAIPKITKITVNAGVGRAVKDSSKIKEAEDAIATITGQKPMQTLSRKSIAGFKIRDNMPIGVSVTLRGEIMYEFLDKLINVAIPRIRDFRGLKRTAFDGRGNYSLGIKEHTVFPELIGQESQPISLQINIDTTAKNNEEALFLLSSFGFPFKKENE